MDYPSEAGEADEFPGQLLHQVRPFVYFLLSSLLIASGDGLSFCLYSCSLPGCSLGQWGFGRWPAAGRVPWTRERARFVGTDCHARSCSQPWLTCSESFVTSWRYIAWWWHLCVESWFHFAWTFDNFMSVEIWLIFCVCCTSFSPVWYKAIQTSTVVHGASSGYENYRRS